MSSPRKILFVSAECAPFARTGGLGDVVGALPKALARLGADVRVVMPLYRGIAWDDLERLGEPLIVPVGGGHRVGAVRRGSLPGSGVSVYFLEHHGYFDRSDIYGRPGYRDNIERFTFLSRGALELTRQLAWIPDLVHAHDWHAALVPLYLETVMWGTPLYRAPSVFTIHNLAHQGVAGPDALPVTGLGWEHYHAHELEHFGSLNLMKGALYRSRLLTTVSPTYAREIQTPELGFGLDGVLRQRSADLLGILNGIDDEEWNPSKDRHIRENFDVDDLSGKAVCKAALQREMGLPERPEIPLFGVVSRMTDQKGMDVLAAILEWLAALPMQLVVLGTGAEPLEHQFARSAAAHPDRFRAVIAFDDSLAHRIEAGADFFVMPSRFEPCGLNQLYSLRYGTLPIVRQTGGLADTVTSYEEATGRGTGFALQDLHPQSLFDTLAWAVSTWYDRRGHVEGMRRRAMLQDFSWRRSAEAYLDAYEHAISRR